MMDEVQEPQFLDLYGGRMGYLGGTKAVIGSLATLQVFYRGKIIEQITRSPVQIGFILQSLPFADYPRPFSARVFWGNSGKFRWIY